MSIHEIVLAETKPETEWVRGRALQKVSPTYWHASLQTLIASAMREWADGGNFGRVGTEWRFRVAPPGEIVRPLVPDVAYLSYATLPRNAAAEMVQVPLHAPTVAVEIFSPDDRTSDVADKIATYLRAGSLAVLVVDQARSAIDLHRTDGLQTFGKGDVFTHAAMPGFPLDVTMLFDRARN